MLRLVPFLMFLLLGSTAVRAEEADYATLKVRVEGIQSEKKGEVGVALFASKKGFPTHIEHSYEPAWISVTKGMQATDHVFEGLPAGEYAVSVVHDENGNRKLERSTLGFPEEGVGFSNGQKVKLSAPDFKDCKFALSEGQSEKILIHLDYRD